jgi:hypothetical protein
MNPLSPKVMPRFRFTLLLIFILSVHPVLFTQEPDLMRDLFVVDCVNQRLCDKMPVTYNNFLQGGYINMPSARMSQVGEVGIGYSSVPPYRNWNARMQALHFLEVSGNYRIFSGIDDPVLGASGFGEFSDKGINLKGGILPEDSDYALPGLAIGFDDVLGTRAFRAGYVVATQVFLKYDFNATLGFGWERLHGFFGGIEWMPLRRCPIPGLQGLSLVAEYDATDYHSSKHEPHPDGRTFKTRLNFGLKYRFMKYLDFTASCVRGRKFSFAISAFYNFGNCEGFVPKVDDPLPYCTPVNTEPFGFRRPEAIAIQDFNYALSDQGFMLMGGWVSYTECGKILRLKIYNPTYLQESEVRTRLNALISRITPSDVDFVIIVMEGDGFPIQEYRYNMIFVREYQAGHLGDYELMLLTPMAEVSHPDPCNTVHYFEDSRETIDYVILPRTYTAFGAAAGKFRYALGLSFGVKGFIINDIYYDLLFGYNMYSHLEGLADVDRLNPSQLINVRTSYINYYFREGVTLDRFYLQKGLNLGCGFFTRVAAGYYDIVYGGLVFEALYYPVGSPWAIGFEYAELRKREVGGFGLWFTKNIRKLNGFVPTYVPFNGRQFFVDGYYDCPEIEMDFRVSAGQFLAKDVGARVEIGKYFCSGLRIFGWYTWTNADDMINGSQYFDKGIGFSMPLDIFYTFSSRERWGHRMSAWQRDCGYRAPTGRRLYDSIHDQRIDY